MKLTGTGAQRTGQTLHTCANGGKDDSNVRDLMEKRANKIRSILVDKLGVNANQISTQIGTMGTSATATINLTNTQNK